MEMLKKQKPTNEGYYAKPVSTLHEFYLTGTIESAENYVEWFDTIRHAGENDAIKIYINSYGGDLFTAIQFLRVLTETNATKIVSVEGACMSAATVIFMCADSFEVTPHSVFMFHNYSGGTIGKGGEMIDQLLHERKWSERLLHDIYADFLTPEEVKSMLDNKDIWMDGEEVVRRINLRIQAMTEKQQLQEEEQEEQEEQEVAPTPRKPTSRKSTSKKAASKEA
jgi:ATP-dependent protease ClpP protease subunit